MKHTVITRRGFLGRAFGLMGATGALRTSAAVMPPQTRTTGVSPSNRYDGSLIFERKRFNWPGGKTLAVWVVPNVEVWAFDSAVDAAISPRGAVGNPDVHAYATRESGMREGLWRIADVLDEAGIKATVALNAAVCQVYSQAVDQMKRRQWEFMGHGLTNSRSLTKLPIDEEKDVIRTTLQTINQATGKPVRGWLSPGQIETQNTPDLLAEAGLLYTGDWNFDDQPTRLKTKTGQLYSLPYCMEINDVDAFSRLGLTAEQYYRGLLDEFDVLYSDSQKASRVMGIPLHPFLTGQPSHIKYVKQAVQHMKTREQVWFATGTEIVEAYRKEMSGD
jgi:allantoinase